MRILRRNHDLINETGPQPFDGLAGSVIVRVTGDNDCIVDRRNERCDSAAGPQGITVPATLFPDLKADMAGAEAEMLRIAHTKVDMPHIDVTGDDDAEMVIRRKPNGRLSGRKPDKMQ